jgi:hypothetical protein
LLVAIFALSAAARAHSDDERTPAAQASPSPTPSSASSKSTPGVDDLITNNNLRAYAGSNSDWSIASAFNYQGGTISQPFDQNRPDISNASGTTAKADLDGNISVKYNLNATNSLMAGIGIRWIAPFSSTLVDYDGDRFDFINPYLQYQYVYKWLGIQSVLQFAFLQWTQTDFTALGYGQQLSVDQENIYEIGKTGLSVGASAFAQYQFFNKSGAYGSPSDPTYVPDVGYVQSVYLFGISPEIEYQLTDKINLRTLISGLTFEHYSKGSPTLQRDSTYQSIGVGFSVTRDIFLYPNIQFLPQDFVSSATNVGLSATINLF